MLKLSLPLQDLISVDNTYLSERDPSAANHKSNQRGKTLYLF